MKALLLLACSLCVAAAIPFGALQAQSDAVQPTDTLTVAVFDLGVNSRRLKKEATRVPDSLRRLLKTEKAVRLLDAEDAADMLMERSRTLDLFATDSAYWNGVAAAIGADVVLHGLVRAVDDTTLFVDLFVVDIKTSRRLKTALLHNPESEQDAMLSVTLRRVVDDLVLFGRSLQLVQAATDSRADTIPPQGTATAGIPESEGSTVLAWIVGGAAVVAALVTFAVLNGDAVEAESFNLPSPPAFP